MMKQTRKQARCHNCGGMLSYQGAIPNRPAAQSWHCSACGQAHIRLHGRFLRADPNPEEEEEDTR